MLSSSARALRSRVVRALRAVPTWVPRSSLLSLSFRGGVFYLRTGANPKTHRSWVSSTDLADSRLARTPRARSGETWHVEVRLPAPRRASVVCCEDAAEDQPPALDRLRDRDLEAAHVGVPPQILLGVSRRGEEVQNLAAAPERLPVTRAPRDDHGLFGLPAS